MKTLTQVMFVIGMAAATGACVTGAPEEIEAEDTGTATAESSLCRVVKRFTYQHPQGGVYRWHVTTQLWDGRQFVDERKIGGPLSTYRQYRVSPVWSSCPHPNEHVRLTSGSYVLDGIHVCLPDGREEFHGDDFQRLLVRDSPFLDYNCQP